MPDFAKALKQLRDRDRQPFLTGMSPVADISLSRQLQFLRSRGLSYVAIEQPKRHPLPPGEVHSTPYGSHYIGEKIFTDGYEHGKVRLNRFSTSDLRILMEMM